MLQKKYVIQRILKYKHILHHFCKYTRAIVKSQVWINIKFYVIQHIFQVIC